MVKNSTKTIAASSKPAALERAQRAAVQAKAGKVTTLAAPEFSDIKTSHQR
jgi:hypothetical protein